MLVHSDTSASPDFMQYIDEEAVVVIMLCRYPMGLGSKRVIYVVDIQ